MSVPLMAIFISPVTAAAIMLPILCLIDFFNLWGYRKHWNKNTVAILLPGAIAGIAIGALTYNYIDENKVRLLLGIITILFAISFFISGHLSSKDYIPNKCIGLVCGVMSGFTSFIAHAGGAPLKFFLIPQKMPKKTFVGTHVFFFFVINQIKIWPYFWLGQFSIQNLKYSLLLVPAVPIGVLLGWWLIKIIAVEDFYRFIYVILLATGVKLVWDGLA